MHHALEIQEILLNIFGHCYPPGPRRARSGLAVLARTCRVFKEPALDVLWEDLDDLYPLMRCIPDAHYRLSSGKYSFTRPLMESEWNILRSYSSRIRSIWDTEGRLDQESTMTLLNPPTTEPLFSNLRYLRCKHTTAIIPLSNLHVPSLTTLDLVFGSAHTMHDYFKSFPKFSPNIRSLSFELWPEATTIRIHSHYFHQWRNIQSLLFNDVTLDADALVHLSSMPALTRLAFFLMDVTLPTSQICFVSLHCLTVRSPSLALVSRFLLQIQLAVVKDITVDFGKCSSEQDLSHFLTAVQISAPVHAIRSLSLNQTDGNEPDVPLLCFEALRPCMAFPNLRRIHIDIEWDVGLTDSDVLTLVSAWPHLEQFSINVNWGWNTLGGITPNGLLQLLQTRRSLDELAIALNTEDYTEFSPSPDSLGVTLPYLNVVDSAIEEESMQAIADLLASLAVDFVGSLRFKWRHTEVSEVYDDRWCAIHEWVQKAICRR